MLSQIGGKHLPALHALMGELEPSREQTAEEMVQAMNRWAALHNAALDDAAEFDPSTPIPQPSPPEAEQQ